ncbi:class I SAM-dependent DNA methyltransferase [Albimonas pacifica]|uniref:Methyltransferase domain-containing protein n=1 Tax=Albimonas pacifica TaxID=1114924 RepID=A0A1I3DAZ2_9RHOB|nr:class I SAM-dependent methyltransferase [Albimonas pacifica]SFH83910.1 Methyltransferase domain-containing protein [Albimonas pacifica]
MTRALSDYDAWAELYDRTLGPAYSALKMGFLERRLLDRLPAGARVLDLCCGSGRMMAPMLARGFAVSGLDLSADMLRLAARNAPGAELRHGDARDFHYESPFAGAVCASASLNHIRDLDELERVFRAVHAALEDGGLFVFDINHPAQMAKHWQGRTAAGEIAADHAWSITPRYAPERAEGAFRVDLFRRPQGAPAPAGGLTRALLRRPLARRLRLRRLEAFAARHPDWAHRAMDFPVHGHPLDGVAARLEAVGFDVSLETLAGRGEVGADDAACFVCRARPALPRRMAAE